MDTRLRLNRKRIGKPLALSLALSAGTCMTMAAPVLAQNAPAVQDPSQQGQMENTQPLAGPLPDTWNSAWDSGTYDRAHYLVGTVASFTAYRLLVAQGNDVTTQIDLKKGTVIRPTGLNLAPGEHVAVVGYWSKGTFIANRVVLRRD